MPRNSVRLAAAAALLSLSMLATACATGGTSSPGNKTSGSGNPFAGKISGKVTVWSWDVAAAALKRLAPEYEKKHPGTEIDVIDIGYDNAYDKISVALQAGSGLPDLVSIETDRMPGYISQFPKSFYDVTRQPDIHAKDFDPSKVAASTGKDGGLYSIPWDSGTVALYYRRDYLDKAGIDPASLDTWDATLAAGEKVKAATGHTLFSIEAASSATFLMLLQQQGLGIFDKQGEITVNSPEAVRTLAFLKKVSDKGLLDNVRDWSGLVSAAKAGKSATAPSAVWWSGTLMTEMKEQSGKYGVVPLPVFNRHDAPTSNNGGSTLAVPTQAKNPALAGSFAAFALADTANQVSMMKKEGLFPSYLPALESPYFQAPIPYFGGQKAYALFAELTPKILPVAYNPDYSAASDVVANAVAASVLNGQDPKKALDDAADQIANASGRKIAS